MQLGDIVLMDGVPTISDGVECNPDLFWVDIMNEVAFMVMDLHYHDRPDYALRFLDNYLEKTGDYAGLGLFRYYFVYRAMMRATVAIIRALQGVKNKETNAQDVQRDRYFQIAFEQVKVETSSLFITHGLSGSGKSMLSARIVGAMGVTRIRLDRERQCLLGKGDLQRNPADIETGVYSSKATAQTYTTFAPLAEIVSDAGYSVIVDVTFLDRRQRRPCFELDSHLGVSPGILSFRADVEVLLQGMVDRQRTGEDISEAGLEGLAHQLNDYTDPKSFEDSPVAVIATQASCTGSDIGGLDQCFTFPTTRVEGIRIFP